MQICPLAGALKHLVGRLYALEQLRVGQDYELPNLRIRPFQRTGKPSDAAHIVDIRERIRINGELVSHEDLVELVKRIEPVLKKMGSERPTFFEIFTAMSFCHFADQKVDIAVIETGMGGRLDSTNVITPEVCAITSISKDHMSVLGNTTSKIAEEKAGIFKKDVPAVT